MNNTIELMGHKGSDSRKIVTLPSPAPASHLPSRYPPRVAAAQDDMPVATLWRIIRDHKRTIATFTLVVVAIVLAASLLLKPKYEAIGRVVVMFHRENNTGVLGFKGVDAAQLEDSEDAAALDTQIGILQTDALAMQVISDLHLDSNPAFVRTSSKSAHRDLPVKAFHNALTLSKVKGTRIIEIKFRCASPQLAADVVNDLAKAYVDQYYRSRTQFGAQLSDFLANQLQELQLKVEESQQKLVDYQKANGISGLDEKQNIVSAKLDDLNKELTAAEADRVQREVTHRLASSGRPELLAKLEPGALLTTLRAQQADLEDKVAQASVQLGPDHPKMKELVKQLAQARKAVHAEETRIGEHIDYEYRSALGRERMLRAALETQKQAADKLSASAVQSEILKHEFETNRRLYDELLQKQKEIGISASLKSSNIWIVDPARPPRLPVEPNIPRNLAISLLAGLCGGVLLAVGLAKMDDRTISTLEQAQGLSPAPALGVLPLVEAEDGNGSLRLADGNGNGHVNPALVSLRQPMSLAAESYRAVLTSILLAQSPPPQVIQVTSALPGEGKTTVSVNLAILLARLRKRVLLVDADLRRPRVHLAMRLKVHSGLGALLRSSTNLDLAEALVSCAEVPNLCVLPAYPVKLPDDTELLMSRFKELIEYLREQFDHIVIDTPPVLPMADAVRMSVEADSVVLVVRSGQIERDTFLQAQESLFRVKAPLVGFLLNGAPMDSTHFRYYHSYYSPDQAQHSGRGR